jgi:hypothetical protein
MDHSGGSDADSVDPGPVPERARLLRFDVLDQFPNDLYMTI